MKNELQNEILRGQENVKMMKKYASHVENQRLVHNDEKHELELRVLREESLSSASQAKTLKSIAVLINQVSKVVELMEQKRKKEKEDIRIDRERVENCNVTNETEGNIEEAEDPLFHTQTTASRSIHTPDQKDEMRERQLIHNLGETCTRWMVLIEKKLPKLVASSQRTRMDIGKLRRERPLKESANVKQVGYKDQIKKMKESNQLIEGRKY